MRRLIVCTFMFAVWAFGRTSASTLAQNTQDTSIRVEVLGQIAKLANNADFEVRSGGVTWEVDVSADGKLREAAERSAGRTAVVKGTFVERRDGARTRQVVTANAIEIGPTNRSEYISATIDGVVRTGVMAIGAETTGIAVTAAGVTWDLELTQAQRSLAASLSGRIVRVIGDLKRVVGVERGNRFVVTVRSLEDAQR